MAGRRSRATRKAAKAAVTTKTGRRATRAGARVAAKTAGRSGKGFAKSPLARKAAGKTARGAGKAALGAGKARARSSVSPGGEPTGSRFLRYGLFALAGLAVGALIGRSGSTNGASSSYTGETGHHTPDAGSPAGQRGETWGSGTPLGTAGGGGATAPGNAPPPGSDVAPPPLQRPEDVNRTGAEREYSDPASGPLIGQQHRRGMAEIPDQPQEVEQRIRTRIGEDPRTTEMPRVNVEVNDGVAELRGEAPSEEAKEAAGEIAAATEGVSEVRNLLTVNPESPTRDRPSGDPDLPS